MRLATFSTLLALYLTGCDTMWVWQSPDHSNIYGTVEIVDSLHHAISGQNYSGLTIQLTTGSEVRSAHPSASGAWSFGGVPVGDAQVSCTQPGYSSSSQQVRVNGNWDPDTARLRLATPLRHALILDSVIVRDTGQYFVIGRDPSLTEQNRYLPWRILLTIDSTADVPLDSKHVQVIESSGPYGYEYSHGAEIEAGYINGLDVFTRTTGNRLYVRAWVHDNYETAGETLPVTCGPGSNTLAITRP